jgi:hypothetical protein
MNAARAFLLVSPKHGSTLLVALLTITTLSLAMGAFVATITNRSQVAFHSASWHTAGLAAESAADLAVAEIRRVMPELNTRPVDSWSGWTAAQTTTSIVNGQEVKSMVAVPLPTAQQIAAGVTLSLVSPALVHGGEAATTQSGVVRVDAPASLLLNGRQWLRVRSEGTALLPGLARLSPEKLDNRLRRLAFQNTPSGLPQTSRRVEMIVRPVLPFEAAIHTNGSIAANHAEAIVDSFDSGDVSKSTGGEYDSAKRQLNGTVQTNGSTFAFAGTIHGNVATNGGTVASSSRIAGTVRNDVYQPLPPVAAPEWSSFSNIAVGAEVELVGGPVGSPRRYKLESVNGAVLLAGGTEPTAVEVWIPGNMVGALRIGPNVQAKIYVGGNVTLRDTSVSSGNNGNGVGQGNNNRITTYAALENQTRRAANLQIYGITPPTGEARSLQIALGREVHAAVYAPGHDLTVTGTGDVMGSLVTRSLTAADRVRFHFDQALAANGVPVIDYKAVSWVEDLQ